MSSERQMQRKMEWRTALLHTIWLSSLVCLIGCQRYPEFSPAAFELAKAVDNLCNLKNAEQLPLAREKIAAEHQSGAITDREQQWLIEIVAAAEANDWESASARSQQMLQSQQNR
ncbi:hypothetical protein GC163_10755 [bacterium]|nr:hypothetical protein [bacterium]